MRAEDELTLSYYKKIDEIDVARRIELVRHIETGRIFVRKTLSVFDPEVFRILQSVCVRPGSVQDIANGRTLWDPKNL